MNTTILDKIGYAKAYVKLAAEDRKNFWKPLLKMALFTFALSFIISFALGYFFGESFLVQLIIQLVSMTLSLFSFKFILNTIDNGKASISSTIKSFNLKQVLFALVAYFLTTIFILLGFILLIVPGVIISFMLIFTALIGSEKTMTPLAAMKESKRLTSGYKMKIFNAGLTVAVHYALVPIFAAFGILLAGNFELPMFIIPVLVLVLVASAIYAQFAYYTLFPRMYRDLQMIQGSSDNSSEEKEEKSL